MKIKDIIDFGKDVCGKILLKLGKFGDALGIQRKTGVQYTGQILPVLIQKDKTGAKAAGTILHGLDGIREGGCVDINDNGIIPSIIFIIAVCKIITEYFIGTGAVVFAGGQRLSAVFFKKVGIIQVFFY